MSTPIEPKTITLMPHGWYPNWDSPEGTLPPATIERCATSIVVPYALWVSLGRPETIGLFEEANRCTCAGCPVHGPFGRIAE